MKNKLKRYWLFLCPCYYPSGGMDDFIMSFDTIKGAVQFSQTWVADDDIRYDLTTREDIKDARGHIIDSHTGSKVMIKDSGYDFITAAQHKKKHEPKKYRMSKGKKPVKLKRLHLKKSGYQYKLEHLNEEERDELENGKKIEVKGKPARGERPDFFYWFKMVQDVEVRIYEVGPDFYWNQGKLSKPEHIEVVEQKAIEQAYWDKKIASIPDTKPPEPTINRVVEEKASPWPHVIELSGGPLDGQKRPYHTGFLFFMEQVQAGTEDKPEVIAPRYKREKEGSVKYIFDQMF